MSVAIAMPPVPLSRTLTRQWILAYAGAAAVCALGSLAVAPVTDALDLNAVDAGWTAKSAGFVLLAAAELIYGLAYAYLRGAVLRQMLPNLPVRTWCVVVAAVVAGIAAIGGLSASYSADGTPASLVSADKILIALIGMSLVGMVAGFVIGAAEALVLRKVATGTGLWVAISTAAHGAGVPVMFLAVSIGMLQPGLGATAVLLVGLAARMIMQATVGAIMLAGLASLQPR